MSAYKHFTGLVIAVPHTGRGLPPEWTYAYHNLLPPMNFSIIHCSTGLYPSKPAMVDEARNYFANVALQNNAKYLLFIDEDVTPPAHALRNLWFVLEHHPEIAVVGGVICHKQPPHDPMLFREPGAGCYWDWKVGELFEIWGMGMGCTMIRTDIFNKIEMPWFKTIDDVSQFMEGTPGAARWTEDLSFCKKVNDAGYKVYCDSSVICDHWDLNAMKPYSLSPKSKPFQQMSVVKGAKKILDVGCGEVPYKTDEGEVLTADIREDVGPDYRVDIRNLPFATGEFDVVFSSHTLEHFARNEVEKTLDEWIRVLKPDGELRLVLPNVEWAADEIKKGLMNEDILNVLYGAQTYSENFHKFCFTPKTLEELLKKKGFKRMDFELTGYNIAVKATRSEEKKELEVVKEEENILEL